MSVADDIEAQVGETELFRANEDLRTAGVTTRATLAETHPAASVMKGMCASVANSPIVRTLLLLVVVALLLYVIERLSGGTLGQQGENTMREMLRSLLKTGMQQAAAMPVLERGNTTNATTLQ
jgi:hypothetical protein